ncbi:unnamed protein product [Leptosia nina]|uniref:Peptidase S1 domain-containing protein n=1 Tax=Leptosia nina TaxID=320188 RepID=A0AAV1JX12_9NEOP
MAILGLLEGTGLDRPALDYHEAFGIPEADRIWRWEQTAATSKLIGASPALPGTFPYFGGLLIGLESGATSVCGCTVVSPRRALTAAHCARGAARFTVVLGSERLYTGGLRLHVTPDQVEQHSLYDPLSLNYDIAMVAFPAVAFDDNIRPIALASGGDDHVGEWALATGFGKTSDAQSVISGSSSVRQVSLRVISNAECSRVFKPRYVVSSTLCTGGGRGSTCSGDSGGPLALGTPGNATLIGVTSFVSTRGCELGLPAGFTRVSALRSWILRRL